MTDDILDVKMPPEPEPEPVPFERAAAKVSINEDKNITMIINEVPEEETPQGDEEEEQRPIIPDEDIFPEAPKVKKVKRKASEKQLAHLARMREKKAEKDKEKREWLEEQKQRQKKYVNSDKESRSTKKKVPKKTYRPPTPVESSEEEEEEDYHSPPQEIFHKLTAGELRQIQRDAIMDYDALRKQRKYKKEIYMKQVQEEKQLRSNMAMMSKPDNDPWADAFSFQ
jgi:hypothetical protein